MDDWKEARDILHCSDNFHGELRRDCVLVNMDSPDLCFARIYGLFRVKYGGSAQIYDIALVRMLNMSNWKPRSTWDGIRVYEEEKNARVGDIVYKNPLVPTLVLF